MVTDGGMAAVVGEGEDNGDNDGETTYTCPHTFPPPSLPLSTIIVPSPTLLCKIFIMLLFIIYSVNLIYIYIIVIKQTCG
jgi:hypothetical protein